MGNALQKVDIGWIGTGVMGHAMCGHLIAAGHRLHVHSRTRSKVDNLVGRGARWCDVPSEAARASQFVFCMVGYPHDVEQVVLGADGVLAGGSPGTVIVDMTTSSPALAEKIYAQAAERDMAALDAPVSGGDIGAREATLAIMVGGDKLVFDRVNPLFQLLGKRIAYMGPAGSGQHTKMCNQILLAGTMIGVVESLLYAYKAGMDLDAVIDVIGQGAASCWAINNLGRRIAHGDLKPGFYIKHFVKDMEIALNEARRMNLCLPGLSLINQFYAAARAQGLGDMGTQGLYKVLSELNGIQVPDDRIKRAE